MFLSTGKKSNMILHKEPARIASAFLHSGFLPVTISGSLSTVLTFITIIPGISAGNSNHFNIRSRVSMDMLNDFVEKVQGFLIKPVETFKKSREDTLGNALTYYIMLVVINAILSTLVLLAGISTMTLNESFPGMQGAHPAILFVGIIVGGIVAVFIGGAWLHIFVWLLGGRKDYFQTVKALMYGSTPGLLISWIPIIGFIGALWTLILEILGIQELQEMSTGKAVAAVILAVVIFMIIIILLAALFFMAFFTSGVSSSSFITN